MYHPRASQEIPAVETLLQAATAQMDIQMGTAMATVISTLMGSLVLSTVLLPLVLQTGMAPLMHNEVDLSRTYKDFGSSYHAGTSRMI